MAEESQSKVHEQEATETEIKDRGLFDLLGKKKEEEKPQDVAITTEFEKVKVSDEHESPVEEKKEEEGSEKKHSLLEKLHRSDSSSSSSSDEEGEGGEKKKKKKEKKGLKEKMEGKIGDDHKEEEKHEDAAVPVEKVEADPSHPEEKKGFLDKIKEKLPGQHKKAEEVPASPPSAPVEHQVTAANVAPEGETKEKKGIFEKIKEKLPGYHSKTEEEKEKEKEREAGDH